MSIANCQEHLSMISSLATFSTGPGLTHLTVTSNGHMFHHSNLPQIQGLIHISGTVQFGITTLEDCKESQTQEKHDLAVLHFFRNLDKRKDLIFWMVSDCHPVWSKRHLYVEKLKRFLPVKIFGLCGNRTACPPTKRSLENGNAFSE